jgi:nickel-dependent lactate racemase
LILNTVFDSKKINVERIAGDYLRNQDSSSDIKSIDADRVLFFAGLPLDSIILSSSINVNEADILVIQSNSDIDVSSFNDFEEIERFVKKNKHISIMKRKL